MHMIGATAYVIFIPSAIILNDLAEEKVACVNVCVDVGGERSC